MKFADEQKNNLEYFIWAIEGFTKDAKWRIHSSDEKWIPTPDLMVNSIANLYTPERVNTMPEYPNYGTTENNSNIQIPSDFLTPFADSKKSFDELLENSIKAHIEKHLDLQNSRLIDSIKQSEYMRPNKLEKLINSKKFNNLSAIDLYLNPEAQAAPLSKTGNAFYPG